MLHVAMPGGLQDFGQRTAPGERADERVVHDHMVAGESGWIGEAGSF
jgi:hypothetical protein